MLRKGRDVDIIVCFDASADIEQENWLSLVDDYAKQQSVTSWPIGAGWPKKQSRAQSDVAELVAPDPAIARHAASDITKPKEAQPSAKSHPAQNPRSALQNESGMRDGSKLGFCNVWVGKNESKIFDENPPSKRLGLDEEWRLLEPDSGMTVVYLPFLPNPKIEDLDPGTSTFMSTWNFVYNSEEIDKVVALAKANFEEGEEQMKSVVRAVYQRKRARRLYMEGRDEMEKWRLQLRNHGDSFS